MNDAQIDDMQLRAGRLPYELEMLARRSWEIRCRACGAEVGTSCEDPRDRELVAHNERLLDRAELVDA